MSTLVECVPNFSETTLLLAYENGLYIALREKPAYVPDGTGGGGYVFDEGRFGIASFGHGALSGKYGFAPARAEFVRTFAEVVFQEDFVHRSTFQSNGHGVGTVGESGFLAGKDGAQIGIFDHRNVHVLVGYQYDILSPGRGRATDDGISRINQRVFVMVRIS